MCRANQLTDFCMIVMLILNGLREYILFQPSSGQCSPFVPPENTTKPKAFLVFSGGIKWEH